VVDDRATAAARTASGEAPPPKKHYLVKPDVAPDSSGILEPKEVLTSRHAGQDLFLEPPDGIEPSTYALRVRRSSRLS
jgi:hypothetical protein